VPQRCSPFPVPKNSDEQISSLAPNQLVGALYALFVASFDSVSPAQRGYRCLVRGNDTSGTFVFEIKQTDVIRVWVYVPQDAAFSASPDLDAIMRMS
jgi:hypothetical protein